MTHLFDSNSFLQTQTIQLPKQQSAMIFNPSIPSIKHTAYTEPSPQYHFNTSTLR
jgi:hypothetical protein